MKPRPVSVEFYADAKGEFRWRMKRAGRVLADSGEGYRRKRDSVRALRSLLSALDLGYYEIKEIR